jgi:acetolactate synthase-1/3 small subunit
MMMTTHKHIIAALVENKPGVMMRISGLFARRGFNIESIAVGTTEMEGISRMTIIVPGDDRVLEQVEKQLNKQIDVLKVSDLDRNASVVRELCLVKVSASSNQEKMLLMNYAEIFRAKVVDVDPASLTFEITGDEQKVEALVNLLRPHGIKEMARTGTVAMARGPKATEIPNSR